MKSFLRIAAVAVMSCGLSASFAGDCGCDAAPACDSCGVACDPCMKKTFSLPKLPKLNLFKKGSGCGCEVAPACDSCDPCARPKLSLKLPKLRLLRKSADCGCDAAPACDSCAAPAPMISNSCASPVAECDPCAKKKLSLKLPKLKLFRKSCDSGCDMSCDACGSSSGGMVESAPVPASSCSGGEVIGQPAAVSPTLPEATNLAPATTAPVAPAPVATPVPMPQPTVPVPAK